MTSQEINEKRLGVVAQMRAMHEKLNSENRSEFTGEEQQSYDRMRAEEKNLIARRDMMLEIEAAEKELATPARGGVRPGIDGAATNHGPRATADYKKNFLAWARHGDGSTPMEILATLEKATGPQGGYLVPIEFETKIVLKMYDANLMRQLATVIRTTSQVNLPMEGNLPTFGWIGELGTYPATDATLGQNILGANKLGGIITVSEELLTDAFLDVGDYIAGRAAIAAGFAEEAAFVSGDGNQKPTGWLTTAIASAAAVVAGTATVGSANVTSAANSTTNSTDMLALQTAVPRPYRKNGSFIVSDSALQKLRGEKATTGQYLWQVSLTADAPDMYLGKPIYTSDFLAAFAPGSVSAAFGDFSYYQIVDRVGWSMQRLNELYAATGQIGFKMSERTDGKLLRPEAIAIQTTHA